MLNENSQMICTYSATDMPLWSLLCLKGVGRRKNGSTSAIILVSFEALLENYDNANWLIVAKLVPWASWQNSFLISLISFNKQ